MKLTIEIHDAHTGAILEFVSALVAKSITVEATTDHAPGHPELPWPVAGEMDGPVEVAPLANMPSLPEGIPAPPEGFVFLSLDPLTKPADDPTFDLIWFSGDKWVTNLSWNGTNEGPWAARIGSDVAKANGVDVSPKRDAISDLRACLD